ncbi:MAG: hypothetical protein V1847_03975 [Candidatus Diapherotrites archaeon]
MNYPVLNKIYVAGLGIAGLFLFASFALKFIYDSPAYKHTLTATFFFVFIALVAKILVWYSVYSDTVTREQHKHATAFKNLPKKIGKRKQ